MKKNVLFFLVFLTACSAKKTPKVYPDLFQGKLISTNLNRVNLIPNKTKAFWIHSFKAIATQSSSNCSIKLKNLEIEQNFIGDRFKAVADSIGAKARNQFNNQFHFYDSEFLIRQTMKNYRLHLKQGKTKQQKEIIRKSKIEEHFE